MEFRRPEMVAGIVKQHGKIFQVEGVTQAGFHTDVGGDATEHQVADARARNTEFNDVFQKPE